ncbi:MAG: hypothetical protein IT342_17035 [Candidatus Melainabacteria bacterium]|nr:hypothetical protein [Candidatus Melainabacteria bacterium]
MKNAIAITTGNGNDIIPGTNWTYADAAAMAKEVSRERRLFGNRSNRRRHAKRNDGVGLMVSDPARFTAETGWTPEDALEMALDIRREERIFGSNFRADDHDGDVETFNSGLTGDSFYILSEDGSFDKEAMRERRLFGSSNPLWN